MVWARLDLDMACQKVGYSSGALSPLKTPYFSCEGAQLCPNTQNPKTCSLICTRSFNDSFLYWLTFRATPPVKIDEDGSVVSVCQKVGYSSSGALSPLKTPSFSCEGAQLRPCGRPDQWIDRGTDTSKYHSTVNACQP